MISRHGLPTSHLSQAHLPCPCGDSSDAFSTYTDGHGYCFSCNKNFKEGSFVSAEHDTKVTNTVVNLPIINLPSDTASTYEYLPQRGLTKETMQFYGIRTRVDSSGRPTALGFDYGPLATKVRSLDKKEFHSVGDMANATLFGKDKFSAGSSRSITICEGELDAASVFQILGSKYPAVSVRSGSTGRKDCERERDYLNSFDQIYLCFDNDKVGQDLAKAVAPLFDFNKVYHVQMSLFKDANEYLTNGKAEEFKRLWYNAKRFLPEGILSSYNEFDEIIDSSQNKEGVPYPFKDLQEITYGIRTGEVALFTAMEGIGKTEVIRAIEFHLLKHTDANLGIIHLEEGKDRLLKGLAGYQLRTPVHLPTAQVSNDDVKKAIRDLTQRDERLHVYSHFGSSDPNVILDTIRFLVTSCHCKYVFLDHITMVVSGLSEDDERKTLDYISTRLAMMVEELDFALILVSHVNDEGKTRGSRNISKIADLWIHLNRDKSATSESERNTTYLDCRKNRFGARTGPAGVLYFDFATFVVSDDDPSTIVLPPTGE